MISFIIIGRNEEVNLKACIQSIYASIAFNKLQQYEIIYVDSKSTDRSIELVKGFEEIKIFMLTGYCNAAIARNAGAANASGDILFFIDADMEISKEFLKEVLDDNKKLKHDLVSGLITDIEQGVVQDQRFSGNKPGDHKPLDGGIFLIKRSLWDQVNGMRTKFDNGEDGDLGLRLAEKGYYLTRINKTIALHHTISYYDNARIWKMLFNKSMFYCRCVLYRDHLLSKYMYHRIWKDDKTFILLALSFILSIIYPLYTAYYLSVYLLGVFTRSLKQKQFPSKFKIFFYYIILDTLNFIYLFSFFPKNKKEEYLEVKSAANAAKRFKLISPQAAFQTA